MNRIRMISDYLEQLKHRREVRYTITLLAVILSALVQSYVLQVFARPSGIISGGFTGLAMLVERLGELRGYHIPMQVTMLLLNIPVAVLCCKGISLRLPPSRWSRWRCAACFFRCLPSGPFSTTKC